MLSKRTLRTYRQKCEAIKKAHRDLLWPVIEKYIATCKKVEQGYRFLLEDLLRFLREKEERRVSRPEPGVVATLWEIAERVSRYRRRKPRIRALELIRYATGYVANFVRGRLEC